MCVLIYTYTETFCFNISPHLEYLSNLYSISVQQFFLISLASNVVKIGESQDRLVEHRVLHA